MSRENATPAERSFTCSAVGIDVPEDLRHRLRTCQGKADLLELLNRAMIAKKITDVQYFWALEIIPGGSKRDLERVLG